MELPYNIYQFTSHPPFPSTTTKPLFHCTFVRWKKRIFIRFSFSLTIIVHAHALHPFTFVCSANRFFFSLPPTRSFHSIEILHCSLLRSAEAMVADHRALFFSNEAQANENPKRKNILCSSRSIGCKANIHDDDGENASSSFSSSSSVGDLIFKACTIATIVPSLCSGTLCLFVFCLFVCALESSLERMAKKENLHASKSLLSFFLYFFFFFSCSPPLARLHLAPPPPPQTKAVILLPFFWNCFCCCCCLRNHRNAAAAAAMQCSLPK